MQTRTTGKPNQTTQLNQGMVSFSNQILLRQVDTYTTIIKEECVAQLGKWLVDEFRQVSLETIKLSVFSKSETSADNSKRNIFPKKETALGLYRCFHSNQIMRSINTYVNTTIMPLILTLEIWMWGPKSLFCKNYAFQSFNFQSWGSCIQYSKRNNIHKSNY